MNREQFNNYVKGATAQFALPYLTTSTIVNVGGVGWSLFESSFPEMYNTHGFDFGNDLEDAKFVYFGAIDMATGRIQ